MVDWSRLRASVSESLDRFRDPLPKGTPQTATQSPQPGNEAQTATPPETGDDDLQVEAYQSWWQVRWAGRQNKSSWWQVRWANWRAARAERDVLGSYRPDYGEGARFRWWQRLRAGVVLVFVIALMGAGLTMLVGLFFIAVTVALETLV